MKVLPNSWLVLFAISTCGFLGCADRAAPVVKKVENTKASQVITTQDEGSHDHGEGPHGGTILEFGKYHAEFCMDHNKKQAMVYILSGNLKKAVPIAADKLLLSIQTPTFQVDLLPQPLSGEPKGMSSCFVATHENFGKVQEFAGTVSGTIDNKPYLGDFQEKPHTDHEKKK